jgi:pimeloyl-ACP methyl ester carboxylesterase
VLREEIAWKCDDHDLSIGLDRSGTGPSILMLPALSSISTRSELSPLQTRLAKHFDTCCIDWPGFGTLPKPKVDWRPEIYDRYLSHLFETRIPNPAGIIAAGHSAGYVLRYFARNPQHQSRLVLLSPTWRGPLPTMMNGQRGFFSKIVKTVDLPIVGGVLYRLNVNSMVVGMMARGHVYEAADWLRGQRLQAKMAVTHTPGARHASVRFVCGRLDPYLSREEQFSDVLKITNPMMHVYSVNAPRKSRLEMEALAQHPSMQSKTMPRGKLSFYEEYPDETAEVIRRFLSDTDGSE